MTVDRSATHSVNLLHRLLLLLRIRTAMRHYFILRTLKGEGVLMVPMVSDSLPYKEG